MNSEEAVAKMAETGEEATLVAPAETPAEGKSSLLYIRNIFVQDSNILAFPFFSASGCFIGECLSEELSVLPPLEKKQNNVE